MLALALAKWPVTGLAVPTTVGEQPALGTAAELGGAGVTARSAPVTTV